MAEGLLRHMAGDSFEVHSAGTAPKGLHPQTVAAMREIGIDVSSQRSKNVQEYLGQNFDYVITVCDRASQECPVFPGVKPLHWSFEDPAAAEDGELARVFATVRDEIQERLQLFLSTLQ
jgi:arsenate reductase